MKYIYFIIIIFAISSCSIDQQNVELQKTLDFKEDADYSQLVDFLSNVESNGETDFLENRDQVLSWIEAINARYLIGKTTQEIQLFEMSLTRDVYGENVRAAESIRSFSTHHEVNASIEEVWQTLVAVDEFPEWNIFTPRVETTFEIGSPIIMYVRLFPLFPNNIFRQPETVTDFITENEMCWESTFGSEFWMKSHRCYRVSQIDEDSTMLTSYMEYTGVLAPLTNSLTKSLVTIGFNDVAEGLKIRIE